MPSNFGALLFSQPEDQASYQYPRKGPLQAYGIIQDAKIQDPQHINANYQKCLLVIKNGAATGTTISCTNGLESVQRTCVEYDIVRQTSIEIAMLPYSRTHGVFADHGDSGSIVLT